MLNAPPAPFVPERYHFAPGCVLFLVGFGGESDHARLVDSVRATLAPQFDLVTPMPYAALQQMLDESAPPGILAYEKAVYLPSLSEAVISVTMERLPGRRSPFLSCRSSRSAGRSPPSPKMQPRSAVLDSRSTHSI
jgi:hypothetical protein